MLEKAPQDAPKAQAETQPQEAIFTREAKPDGTPVFKSSDPSRKIMVLESGSSIEPQEGVSYGVEIVKDTQPDNPDKGKLIVRIVAEEGVPIAEKERAREESLPLPIEENPEHDKVYVLETELPVKESGPHTPPPEKFSHFTLDKNTLETIEKVATAVELREPCLLEGETSTSKTSSIEYLAMRTGNEVSRFNLNGQTDTSELIGKFVPNDGQLQISFEELTKNAENLSAESRSMLEKAHEEGRTLTLLESEKIAEKEGINVPEWRWQDGEVVHAMQEGRWLILDEINLAEPQILERLNSVLEKDPSLVVSEHGGMKIGSGGDTDIHEDFRIFGTMNPAEYSGRAPMSPAYKDRWTSYKFVSQPTQESYAGMLNLMVYGEQPKVEIQGNEYRAEQTESLFPALSSIENMRGFLAKMAKFHVGMEHMVRANDIGRGKREKYVFTRRGLIGFLDHLEHKSVIDRQTGERKSVAEDPKRIITRAIQYYYLDKITNEDDLRKVKDQLDAIGISEENFQHTFEEDAQNQKHALDASSPEAMEGEDHEKETVRVGDQVRILAETPPAHKGEVGEVLEISDKEILVREGLCTHWFPRPDLEKVEREASTDTPPATFEGVAGGIVKVDPDITEMGGFKIGDKLKLRVDPRDVRSAVRTAGEIIVVGFTSEGEVVSQLDGGRVTVDFPERKKEIYEKVEKEKEESERKAEMEVMSYKTRSGETREFDVSTKACEPFGFYHGGRIIVPTGGGKKATVIGVSDGDLWFHIDGDSGASKWDSAGRKEAELRKEGFRRAEESER